MKDPLKASLNQEKILKLCNVSVIWHRIFRYIVLYGIEVFVLYTSKTVCAM